MNFIERKIQELQNHAPDLTTPDDMDQFWTAVLQETSSKPLNAKRMPIDTALKGVEAYRVVFEGVDGTPVHGNYMVPAVYGQDRYPCVVFYHGYTGSKGLPEHFATYLMAGLAVFSIDIRSQSGDTGDLSPMQDGSTKGWVTKGITSPHTCYYKSIVTDALRAVEWAASQPEVDAKRVGVSGGSQGGGLSLAVSALSGGNLAFAIADIPNMCYMDWSVFNTSGSITEAADYIARYPDRLDTVLKTLSYFDNMNLAHQIKNPVLVSVGFKDPVCPPEAVFAAYNRITAPKQIEMYPFNGHTPGDKHIRKVLDFIKAQVM
jgi:cephalosporin-C deacetylase